jgi:serine/threonine protein kinase
LALEHLAKLSDGIPGKRKHLLKDFVIVEGYYNDCTFPQEIFGEMMKKYESSLAKIIPNPKQGQTFAREKLPLRLFKELLSGLKDMHSYGFVHRDVKSGNIFNF